MGLIAGLGCLAVAYGPPLTFLGVLSRNDPQLVVLSILGASIGLLSITLSAMLAAMLRLASTPSDNVLMTRVYADIASFVSVLLSELFRVALVRLMLQTEASFSRQLHAAPSSVQDASGAQASAPSLLEAVHGIVRRVRRDVGNIVCALAAGIGYGCSLASIPFLPVAYFAFEPGTRYTDSCDTWSYFEYSAILAMFTVWTHAGLTCLLLFGWTGLPVVVFPRRRLCSRFHVFLLCCALHLSFYFISFANSQPLSCGPVLLVSVVIVGYITAAILHSRKSSMM
eukprot:ANDGO_03735.mRNA.1 hypothetical protein